MIINFVITTMIIENDVMLKDAMLEALWVIFAAFLCFGR